MIMEKKFCFFRHKTDFLLQKRYVKVRQFPGATKSDVYDHLKTFKDEVKNTLFYILASMRPLNKHQILDLKCFVVSNAKLLFQQRQCSWIIKITGLLFLK